MFRHSLLRCACFGAALGLAAAPLVPAHGQDRSTFERLDRLERDLNMLQRQVYRGGPAPMAGGDPAGAVNSEIRMDRIETQMRDLTGRVEEFMNQVERLRQRVDQVNGDVEARVSQAPPVSGSYAAASPPPPRSRGGVSSREPPLEPVGAPGGSLTPPGAPPSGLGGPLVPPGALSPPPGGPTPLAGTLTPPGAPTAPPELASAAAPPTARALPSGSTSEQYNHAFGLLKQADYPAAEVALKAFVEQHPNDPMAGNAQYWLGETFYTRGRYAEAATTFAEGYKRWPKSSKAADELLKLGMSLARTNQKQNACVVLAQLDHDFPAPGAAIRERSTAEKKKLGC
jgi:tol-pal system protein YbgF